MTDIIENVVLEVNAVDPEPVVEDKKKTRRYNEVDDTVPKRPRGRPRKPLPPLKPPRVKVTADPAYYHNYYEENLKNVYTICKYCKKEVMYAKISRHERTQSCMLMRMQSQIEFLAEQVVEKYKVEKPEKPPKKIEKIEEDENKLDLAWMADHRKAHKLIYSEI